MGSGIPMDEAMTLAVMLEGVVYGFSLLMFIGTIWALTRKDARCASNRTAMILIAVLLLLFSSVRMIVDIVRIYEGLIKYRDTFPGGPSAYLGDVSQWSFVAENAVYTLQTLVGDGVVIYRCYVVWNSIWIIVVPCLLWCSVAVTGVGSVYSVSQATVNATNIFAKETSQWITSFLVSTLLTNLIGSSLLAYRIWKIERNVASIRASKSTLKPVLYTLIDAAVLYSVTLLVTIISFVSSNNGNYIVVSMVMPIISIAFYMVLIRIALRRNYIHDTWTTTTQDVSHRMRPMHVHISHSSTSDAFPDTPYESKNRKSQSKEEPDSVHYKV